MLEPGMVALAYNPSSWKVEAIAIGIEGRDAKFSFTASLRPARAT